MMAELHPTRSSALRVLDSARQEIEALRAGVADPSVLRGLVLRVANAIDRSLRRMLRDDEAADLSIRLKALAPDELAADAVLGELRRNDRLSVELAAGVHEVLQLRRRLEGGAAPSDRDRLRAAQVAELLEREIRVVRRSTPPAAESIEPTDALLDEPVPHRWRRSRANSSVGTLVVIAIVLVLGIVGAIRFFDGGGSAELDQGLALFEQGEYAEAAQYFWRYAQENPGDATPHLYLARIHRRMERTDLAAGAIREAELLAPEDPAVHRELGFLLLDTGRPDVAVDRFREAIELDEDSAEGWVGLVRALRESGRGEEADQVLGQAPAEVRALLTREDPV